MKPSAKKTSDSTSQPNGPIDQAISVTPSVHPAWVTAGLVGLIVLAVCIVYVPVMDGKYIWDDDLYLTANPLIKASDGWQQVWYDKQQVTYYPLTSEAFWIGWRLWGNDAGSFHLMNILLHALSAVLVWRVLRRLKAPGAYVAALIWAVHPVGVETVAWVSELKNILPMIFSLLVLLAYLHFDDTGKWQWYALSLLAFLAALLSKTAVVALPLTLPLLMWWRHGRIGWKDLLRVLPYLPLALLLGLVTMWFEQSYGARDVAVHPEALASRIAASGWIVWFYLCKIVWPVGLNLIYPRWQVSGNGLLAFVPLTLLVAAFVVMFICRKRWGAGPLVALGSFVILLGPVLGLADIGWFRFSLVADHFQYTAMVAVIALVVGAVAVAMAGRADWAKWRGPLAAVVVVVLGMLTYCHAAVFHDPLTLWRDTKARNDRAWVAWNNLGSLEPRLPVSSRLEYFDRAIELNPTYIKALGNRANAYEQLGRLPEALSDHDKIITLMGGIVTPPGEASRSGGLVTLVGSVMSRLPGQRQGPDGILVDYASAYNDRGLVHGRLGQLRDALRDFDKAIELDPGKAVVYLNRAVTYMQLRRYREAQADLELCREHGGTPPRQLVEDLSKAMGSPP